MKTNEDKCEIQLWKAEKIVKRFIYLFCGLVGEHRKYIPLSNTSLVQIYNDGSRENL